MRKASEKYPDLPRLEYLQQVEKMITPDFIDSLNLDEEQEYYINYKKNKKSTKSKN